MTGKTKLDFEQKQRERIREKYNYECYFCGKSIKEKKQNSVHHICPKSLRGDWSLYNLVCLCNNCHNKIEILNKRMLSKLGKKEIIENYAGKGYYKSEHPVLFNLKYKPNFKWFSEQIDNLFKKELISLDVLNKINGFIGELKDKLNYNHEIDMNHIEVLKSRVLEIESKMKELRAKKHFYRTEMNKYKRGGKR